MDKCEKFMGKVDAFFFLSSAARRGAMKDIEGKCSFLDECFCMRVFLSDKKFPLLSYKKNCFAFPNNLIAPKIFLAAEVFLKFRTINGIDQYSISSKILNFRRFPLNVRRSLNKQCLIPPS